MELELFPVCMAGKLHQQLLHAAHLQPKAGVGDVNQQAVYVSRFHTSKKIEAMLHPLLQRDREHFGTHKTYSAFFPAE